MKKVDVDTIYIQIYTVLHSYDDDFGVYIIDSDVCVSIISNSVI